MNKSQLIDAIAKEANLKKRDATAALDAFIDAVVSTVATGEKVQISGFGSFERKLRKERTVTIPSTKEKMKIPPSKTPSFSAGSIFKEKVNK